MRPKIPFLLAILVGGALCAPLPALDPIPARKLPALWSDGRAEISLYEGRILRYGKMRPLEVRAVVVKEPFHEDRLVKAEDEPASTEVLKLHLEQTFPTGTYGYHRALSLFVDPKARLLKETAVSVDGCGTTFVQMRRESPDRLVIDAHSYWEDEADRTLELEIGDGAVFFDALLLTPRLDGPPDPGVRKVELHRTRLSSRAARLQPVEAVLRLGEPESLEVPAGTFRAWPLVVEVEEERHVLWFDMESPHVLVKRESPDQSWVLTSTTRLAYWKHTDPGDEKLLRP